jgi:hypothetical protein
MIKKELVLSACTPAGKNLMLRASLSPVRLKKAGKKKPTMKYRLKTPLTVLKPIRRGPFLHEGPTGHSTPRGLLLHASKPFAKVEN